MGYGNPLFDGDEPLAPPDPKQRIISMRLWFHGLRPRTSVEEGNSPDRHDEVHGGRSNARSQRVEEQQEDLRN